MPSWGAASFAGIAFHVLLPDNFVPQPFQEVIDAETHIPYSDITIIDHGGLGPWKFAALVKIAPADKAAFEAANGDTGTVILYGTTMGTGKLRIRGATALFDASEYRYDIELVF